MTQETGVHRATRSAGRLTVLTAVITAAAFLNGSAGAQPPAEPVQAGFSLRFVPESHAFTAAQRPFPSGLSEDAATSHEELSAKKAVLYSLLLPGLGDWYAGKKERAKAFFVVDAAIWTSFIIFQVQGHKREESYQDFARQFAGISSTDHSDEFWSTIGQHNTSGVYESEFKKESRIEIWPDVGYDALEAYYLDNRVSDFEEWAWASFETRVDYRELRSSSKVAYRRSGYMIAVAALNRVVASVFAWHAVKSSRGELDDDKPQTGGYRLDFSTPPFGGRGEYAASVSLVRSF
jgi:hypothetical protein